MIKSKQGYKLYSRDEMLNLVKDWYNKNGKIVIRDLRHKNQLPSVAQVVNEFGSFQNCIKEANIPTDDKEHLFQRECLSDTEMLDGYKRFVEEYLKTHIYLPTNKEVDACDYIQDAGVYIRRFGSFEILNQLIGYNQKEFNNDALEKDMLFKYKRACNEYGHTLSSREISKLSKENRDYIYSTEAYLNHFGTIHKLQEICGFDKTIPGRGANREELIGRLQWLGSILGRKPVQKDLILYKNMPSCSTYITEFGSFKEALNEAGFKKERILVTKCGIKVRSVYELKIAQVLESYHIEYKTEIMYKDVIPNFDRKYRFDFRIKINGKYFFIELFGIEGNDLYDRRKDEKIKLCLENNIPLIQLYQSDIYAKTNDEIYDTLLNKIVEASDNTT